MFTTPLHIHHALKYLREAYLKLNDERFNYHQMSDDSQNEYHELVALCESITEKHGSELVSTVGNKDTQ